MAAKLPPVVASRGYPNDAAALALIDALRKFTPNGPPQMASAPELKIPKLQPINNTGDDSATFPVRDELKYANFVILPINVQAAGDRFLLRPPAGTRRVYLMVINTDTVDGMFMNFDAPATALHIPLAVNNGFQEYLSCIPQNDVYLTGAAANVSGVLIYANAGAPGTIAT